jgi:phage shock protein PspC (stress-responsive transcriptional regulator)
VIVRLIFVFSPFHVNMCMFVTYFIAVAFLLMLACFIFFIFCCLVENPNIVLSVFDSAVSDIAL